MSDANTIPFAPNNCAFIAWVVKEQVPLLESTIKYVGSMRCVILSILSHRFKSVIYLRSNANVFPYGIEPIFAYEYGIKESSNGLIAGEDIRIVDYVYMKW